MEYKIEEKKEKARTRFISVLTLDIIVGVAGITFLALYATPYHGIFNTVFGLTGGIAFLLATLLLTFYVVCAVDSYKKCEWEYFTVKQGAHVVFGQDATFKNALDQVHKAGIDIKKKYLESNYIYTKRTKDKVVDFVASLFNFVNPLSEQVQLPVDLREKEHLAKIKLARKVNIVSITLMSIGIIFSVLIIILSDIAVNGVESVWYLCWFILPALLLTPLPKVCIYKLSRTSFEYFTIVDYDIMIKNNAGSVNFDLHNHLVDTITKDICNSVFKGVGEEDIQLEIECMIQRFPEFSVKIYGDYYKSEQESKDAKLKEQKLIDYKASQIAAIKEADKKIGQV